MIYDGEALPGRARRRASREIDATTKAGMAHVHAFAENIPLAPGRSAPSADTCAP